MRYVSFVFAFFAIYAASMYAINLWSRRRRRRRFASASPCRMWRLLPHGRQAVHRYAARVEDLRELKPHLGMRVYVRTTDRVYQWTPARRDEADGVAGVYPVDVEESGP